MGLVRSREKAMSLLACLLQVWRHRRLWEKREVCRRGAFESFPVVEKKTKLAAWLSKGLQSKSGPDFVTAWCRATGIAGWQSSMSWPHSWPCFCRLQPHTRMTSETHPSITGLVTSCLHVPSRNAVQASSFIPSTKLWLSGPRWSVRMIDSTVHHCF